MIPAHLGHSRVFPTPGVDDGGFGGSYGGMLIRPQRPRILGSACELEGRRIGFHVGGIAFALPLYSGHPRRGAGASSLGHRQAAVDGWWACRRWWARGGGGGGVPFREVDAAARRLRVFVSGG